MAYGSAKVAEAPRAAPTVQTVAVATSDERSGQRAKFSLYVLAVSVALSGIGVYLSEKGGRGASS